MSKNKLKVEVKDCQDTYDEGYYALTNYDNYDGIHYRAYHFGKYLILGLVFKFAFNVQTILDVGCATGMSVWVYRNILGMKAYGLDISEFATENAIKSVKKYIVCDDIGAGKLKLKKCKYDMVVSHDTLEHFHPASFDKAIKNIFSITDTALFEIYTLDSLVARLHNLNKIVHTDHLSEHTTNWWINMFSDSGFVATQVPFMRKGTLLVRKRQGNH